MSEIAKGDDSRLIRLIWAAVALGMLVGALLVPSVDGGHESTDATHAAANP